MDTVHRGEARSHERVPDSGIATLHVQRLERHSETALALARALESNDTVQAVYYPGLPSHPQTAVAQRVLSAGGGLLALEAH